TLRVPHLSGTIVLDSDTDDPGWTSPSGPARTGAFAGDDGLAARPYSDARLVWGDGHLYLALYAADEDIESTPDEPGRPVGLGDSFRLAFFREDDGEQLWIDVSPTGSVSGSRRPRSAPADLTWRSGAHVSQEIDGTLNDATDDDEEWVIEMAVPFESLGMSGRVGESIGFAVSRCDKPKNEERRCAGWGDWDPRHGRAGSRLVLGR
ncbi:MAG: hypothetical protein M3O36_03470, partial [Myxococcota bacterium]|nr:hypothetical protein [Myxococcota bacterium]